MADITPLRGEGRTVGPITGLWGELLAEFFGTFVVLAFGDGVVAVAIAGLPGSGRAATSTTVFTASGDWLLITWGWCMAVAMGVWVAGGVSGAHLNPAVSLAFAVRRKFSWKKLLPYWGAQLVGAFTGAALVLAVYDNAINAFNTAAGTPRGSGSALVTFQIFATAPAKYFHGGFGGPLLDQVVGAAFLLIFVAALIDLRNTAVGANLGPLGIGLAVAAIGMSFGPNAGYAINPARDFGPRFLAWIAGWGHTALPGSYSGPGLAFSDYFWVPIVGPLIGGVVGIVLYDLFIGDVLHARLKLDSNVSGPVAESGAGAAGAQDAAAEGIPEARRPAESAESSVSTDDQSPRG